MEVVLFFLVVFGPWIWSLILAITTPKGFQTFLPQTIITFCVVLVLFFIGASYPAGDYGSETGMGFMFLAIIIYFVSCIIMLYRMGKLANKHTAESKATNSDILDK